MAIGFQRPHRIARALVGNTQIVVVGRTRWVKPYGLLEMRSCSRKIAEAGDCRTHERVCLGYRAVSLKYALNNGYCLLILAEVNQAPGLGEICDDIHVRALGGRQVRLTESDGRAKFPNRHSELARNLFLMSFDLHKRVKSRSLGRRASLGMTGPIRLFTQSILRASLLRLGVVVRFLVVGVGFGDLLTFNSVGFGAWNGGRSFAGFIDILASGQPLD